MTGRNPDPNQPPPLFLLTIMPLVRCGAILFSPLFYLSITVTVASLVAYGIHLATGGSLNFSLLVSRGAQVLLLLSLVPFCRALHIRLQDLGLAVPPSTQTRQILVGLAIGVAILTVHVAVLLALRVLKPNPEIDLTVGDFFSSLPGAVGTGLLVASMEEVIFRGVMLSSLARFTHPLNAAWISALYYALLHFVKSDLHPVGPDVVWTSGFAILSNGVQYLLSETPVDSLLALFCAGLFLAAIRWLRPDCLGLCVGIHAGWVVVIKLGRRYTNPDPHVPLAHLVGPYDQIIGYAAAGWIALLLAALLYFFWRARRRTTPPLSSGTY